MALVHSIGKKRRNTGGISSILGEIMRQIGSAGNGKAFNQRFLGDAHTRRTMLHAFVWAEGCFCKSGMVI
jgi:hypothetical protein